MAKYNIDKKWEDSFARFRRAYNLVGNIIDNEISKNNRESQPIELGNKQKAIKSYKELKEIYGAERAKIGVVRTFRKEIRDAVSLWIDEYELEISNTKQNCTGNLQGDDDDAR